MYLERTGATAAVLRELLGAVASQRVLDRHVRQQELAMARCEEATALLGAPVTKQLVVMDMAGLSLWPHAEGFELLRKCVEIDGAHYPETLGTHYIINAPLIFTGMWKVIKKWLDPKTAAKFEVHGTDYRAALLKAIHPSQLPVEYGGTSSYVLPPLLLDAKAARARADALAAARAPRRTRRRRSNPSSRRCSASRRGRRRRRRRRRGPRRPPPTRSRRRRRRRPPPRRRRRRRRCARAVSPSSAWPLAAAPTAAAEAPAAAPPSPPKPSKERLSKLGYGDDDKSAAAPAAAPAAEPSLMERLSGRAAAPNPKAPPSLAKPSKEKLLQMKLAKLEAMSVGGLKRTIKDAGLSLDGCLEKSEKSARGVLARRTRPRSGLIYPARDAARCSRVPSLSSIAP